MECINNICTITIYIDKEVGNNELESRQASARIKVESSTVSTEMQRSRTKCTNLLYIQD